MGEKLYSGMPPENQLTPASNKDFLINTEFNYVYGEWSFHMSAGVHRSQRALDLEVEFRLISGPLQKQYESSSRTNKGLFNHLSEPEPRKRLTRPHLDHNCFKSADLLLALQFFP